MLAYRRKIKNDLFRSLLVLAAPTRLFACCNYRRGSPHVRFKLRFARFHQLSCRTVSVQIWGADSKIKNDPKVVIYFGSPNQIRTGVLALKGRCPGPLDDGAKTAAFLLKTPPNYNRHLYLCQGFLCRCFMPYLFSLSGWCLCCWCSWFRNYCFFNCFGFNNFGWFRRCFYLLKYHFFTIGVL